MEVTKNIFLLESTKGSSIYLLKSEEIILIDASLPGRSKKIINEIINMGINPHDVKHIFLTHHDVDHVGNAKALKDLTGAKLWLSKEDTPYINEEIKRPGLKRLASLVIKIDKPAIDCHFTEDQLPADIQAIHAPGHTPGHTVFIYNDALFPGDLVLNHAGKLILAPGFFTDNKQLLKQSLEKVNNLSFEWICPAHGLPVRKNNLNDVL